MLSTTNEDPRVTWISWKVLIGVTAIAFLCYTNALTAMFAYDDNRAIISNADLLPSTPWINILNNDFWGTPLSHSGSHKSFRPLCTLSFRLNYYVHGLNPQGYHLINVVMHSIVSGLFTWFAFKLFKDWNQTAVAGALFAVHPIHTEAVAGIVGRADIIAALFFLLSLLCYQRSLSIIRRTQDKYQQSGLYSTNWSYFILSVIFCIASMLSKEQGMTVLGVCVVYDVFIVSKFRIEKPLESLAKMLHNGILKRMFLLTLTGVSLLYGRVRIMGHSTPYFAPSDNPASNDPSFCARLLTFLYLPVLNFWLLLFPYQLSFDWSMDVIPLVTSIMDARNLFVLGFYGIFGTVCMLCVIYNESSWISRLNFVVKLKNSQYEKCDNRIKCSNINGMNHKRIDLGNYQTNENKKSNRTARNGYIMSINDHKPNDIRDDNNLGCHENEDKSKRLSNCKLNDSRHEDGNESHHAEQIKLKNQNGIKVNSVKCDDKVYPCSGAEAKSKSNHRNGYKLNCVMDGKSTIPRHSADKNTQPQIQHEAKVDKELFINSLLVSLAITVLPFLPATNLFFYVGFVIAERILYIPSMGYCLLVATGFKILRYYFMSSRGKRIFKGALSLMIILLALRTWRRNFDWQDEESLYRSGIAINPPKAWGNLANILVRKGKIKEAEQAYRTALQHRPNMADTHYNLGILLQDHKRYQEAIESYESAIRCRPRLASAHLNLGMVYDAIGDKASALKVLMNARNISDHQLKDPKTHAHSLTSIRYNIGKILFDLGRYQEAIEAFTDSLQSMPNHYQPHSIYNMLGQTYSTMKDHAKAKIWYLKSIESKQDHIPGLLAYAKHLHATGNIKEAENHFQKAVRLQVDNVEAYVHYGQFLYALNRKAEAAKLIEKGFINNHKDADLASLAGTYYREAKNYEKAEAYYRRALQLKPNAGNYMNLGAFLHLMGKYQEAEIAYLEALRQNPGDELTKLNLHKLRKAMKRKGQKSMVNT